ncbi:MAG: zinc carboxypeptidase [bacterium]|nr:zinc carboxypeptidase [bacterium]
MFKRKITGISVFAILMIALIDPHYSLQETTVHPNNARETVISMNIEDYRLHQETLPQLDRVFCRDGVCYFLVNAGELNAVEASGIAVLEQRSLEDFGFNTGLVEPVGSVGSVEADRVKGDINGAYHNSSETAAMLRDLESRYPDQAQVITIGHSVEGRELNVIKISDNVTAEEGEPNIFIVGAHHAREWISVEVPLQFARHLLENYPDNPEVRQAVSGSQIYIMPVLNPDGLEFTIHTYRWWRKNRRYNGNFTWGVDPNRNYGYNWGYDDFGSSPNTVSGVYRGPSPFSEPETAAVEQFLLAHPPAGALSYHNYSQIIIYPWGYTYAPAPNAVEMDAIAAEMSERMFQVNGNRYEYGSSDILYLVNGDTTDWIYGTFGVPAFTVELPPEFIELGGFFTPEELIESAFSENLPAMLYFVNYFAANGNGNGNGKRNSGTGTSSREKKSRPRM